MHQPASMPDILFKRGSVLKERMHRLLGLFPTLMGSGGSRIARSVFLNRIFVGLVREGLMLPAYRHLGLDGLKVPNVACLLFGVAGHFGGAFAKFVLDVPAVFVIP